MPFIDGDIESNDEELEDEQDEVDDDEEGEDISDDQEEADQGEVEEQSDDQGEAEDQSDDQGEVEEQSDDQGEAEDQSEDQGEVEDKSDDQGEAEEQSDDHVETEEQSDDQGEAEEESDDADEDPDADEEVDDEQESDTSENSSSESRAIQVEPDDDASEDPDVSEEESISDEKGSDTTEQSSRGDTVIEMGEEEEDEHTTTGRKKDPPSPFFWFCCVVAILVAIAGVVCFVYFVILPTPCLFSQSYKWLKDEPIMNTVYRNNLFSGQVTYSRMFSICDRVDKELGTSGPMYLNSAEDENIFDGHIKDNMAEIFGELPDKKKLVWTGSFYEWSVTEWKLVSSDKMMIVHFNLCSNETLKDQRDKLQAETNKNDRIHVVKDFGESNACWRLYNSTQLADIMGQPKGTIPRLSFACSSVITTSPDVLANTTLASEILKLKRNSTGQEAVPGFFQPKIQKGNFVAYGVYANIDDAKKECESQNAALVTIDSPAKMKEVTDSLLNDTWYYSGGMDSFWTGGYLDVSEGYTRNFKWFGSPNTVTKYSTELFKGFSISQLDLAIKKLLESIKSSKDQVRDCDSRDFLYVGMAHPKSDEYKKGKQGLTILNHGGTFNQDAFKSYVLCEKKG